MKEGMKSRTSPWTDLKGQIYLGDEYFVEKSLREISGHRGKLREVPKKQKYANKPKLSEVFEGIARSDKRERNLAIYKAHVEKGYKLQEIADYLNLHYASISRLVVLVEREMLKYNGLLPK